MTWTDRAACAGQETDWWFTPPSDAAGRPNPRHAQALAICLSCPVRQRCAFENRGEPEGLWGGVWREPRYRDTRASREFVCQRCGELVTLVWPSGQLPYCDKCLLADPATRKVATRRLSRQRAKAKRLEGEVEQFEAAVVLCETEWEQVG